MSSPTWQTIKHELLSFSFVATTILVACIYILFSVCLLNYRLVTATFIGNFSFAYKFSIVWSLLLGITSTMSSLDATLLFVTSLLVGANLVMIVRTIYVLEHLGKVKVSIGGATLIALVTTGCASCGLSLLSILGFSSSLAFLPFRGLELHIGALLLLLISLYYMLWQLYKRKYCKIKS